MEGCESFVDDLIGCRVLYSVRDALLHRSLEIQPWHFPIRYILITFKKVNEFKNSSLFFIFFYLQATLAAAAGARLCDEKKKKNESVK